MFASIESNLRHCGPLLTHSYVRVCIYVHKHSLRTCIQTGPVTQTVGGM